jgi:N-methylhydantoinase A
VTDANVVLGRLSPESLLGGRMKMHPGRAREAVEALARKLGVDPVQAAAGVIEIVNVNMMGAVRVISIEQGEDPRDFALVAFGGAGPLHAVEVAAAMGMRHVLVPARPGLLSAEGLLQADQRGDFSLTRLVTLGAEQLPAIDAGFAELRRRGELWLAEERAQASASVSEWSADLRYVGQSFELVLPLAGGSLDPDAVAVLVEAFHQRHREYYGYDIRDQAVELVNLRLALTVPRPRPAFSSTAGAPVGVPGNREVWFPATGYVRSPVFDRSQLLPGMTFDGPAVVEQMDATTVVPPSAKGRIDDAGNLHITLGEVRS